MAGLERAADRAEQPIDDDRLRLLFTCCHPALPVESRVALTLRMAGGLDTRQIAKAFLISESTASQRLLRAKSVRYLALLARRADRISGTGAAMTAAAARFAARPP